MANFSTDSSACMERSTISSKTFEDIDQDVLCEQFDVDKACNWINDNDFEKVCLQFPDEWLHISDAVYGIFKRKTRADIFILADTTYSSCCVDEITAAHVKADAVVHYGHSCLSTSSIPVFTSLPKHCLQMHTLAEVLRKYVSNCDASKLCLFYDAAFNHLKDQISDNWFKINPSGYIANIDLVKSENTTVGRQIFDVTGESLKVNDFQDFTCIYLGSHSQALFNCVISINSKWLSLEPDSREIKSLDESVWFKRRRFLIEKCKDANNIGILVCKLSGQTTKDIILRMKELCKKNHKKSYILSVGKPNVAKLANFPEIDIYVLIACPENDLYSCRDFYRPLVYPYELELALNIKRPYLHNIHVTNFEHLLPNHGDHCDIDVAEPKTDVSLISGKIREHKICAHSDTESATSIENTQWIVETIGDHLTNKSWAGLQQNLGETSVKKAEIGRSGLPISYENEPKQ